VESIISSKSIELKIAVTKILDVKGILLIISYILSYNPEIKEF